MEQTFKNIEERYSIFSENELSIICDKAIYDFDPKTSIIRFLNDPKLLLMVLIILLVTGIH